MFKEIVEQCKKNKIVVGTAAFIGIASGFYIASRYFRQKQKSISQLSEKLNVQKSTDNPQKLFARIINKVKAVLKGQKVNLSFQAIQTIFRGYYQLSNKEFQSLSIQNRIERRKDLNNLRKYHESIIELQQKLEELHNKHLNSILANVDIDRDVWNRQIERIAVDQQQRWYDVLISTQQNETDSLRNLNKPPLNNKVIIQLLKLRLKHLKQIIPSFQQTLKGPTSMTDIYATVEKWGEDKVYELKRVEIEDINSSLKTNQISSEERQKIEGLQQEIRQLMESLIHYGNDESHEQSINEAYKLQLDNEE